MGAVRCRAVTPDSVLVAVVATAIVVGIAGTMLPIVPGIWLIWAATLVYGLASHLGTGGIVAMAVITGLAVAGTAAGVWIPQRQAAKVGIPWWGQVVAAITAILGLFVIPVVGALVGFVLGLVVVSFFLTRDVSVALPAAWTALRSMLVVSGVQLATGVLMAIVWVAWVAVF